MNASVKLNDFEQFKTGPARSIFRAMQLDEFLDAAASFRMLRRLIVDYNDCDKGLFVDAVRRYEGVCSSGERVLLLAICCLCDFAWLADELQQGLTWQQFSRVGGDYRKAVAACIAAEV